MKYAFKPHRLKNRGHT